jgi:5'(3')-deoxyribonucleotidase
MDGVIADFVTAASELHKVKNPWEIAENFGKTDMVSLLGMSATKFFKGMDFDFWANMPKMHDADEIVKTLEGIFGTDNICILSSPTFNDGCMPGKRKWLEKNFPQLKGRFLFGSHKDFCAAEDHILIDDRSKNCEHFLRHGGHVFLVPRRWNHRHNLAHRSVKELKTNLQVFESNARF